MTEKGTIKEILHIEVRHSYALVHVLLEDGLEAVVWVGGDVKVRHDPIHNRIEAHVLWKKRVFKVARVQ